MHSFQALDKSACGVGFLASRKNIFSHAQLELGLHALRCVEHRGACAADQLTGDGAGIMTDIPFELFGIERNTSAVATLFVPTTPHKQRQSLKIFEEIFHFYGMEIIKYRDVPTNPSVLGEEAKATLPVIIQAFIKRPVHCRTDLSFDKLWKDLWLLKDDFILNDDYIKCNENGDVKLFYSNVEKLATTNTGVDITGSVQSSTGTFQLDTNDKIAITASNIGFHLDGAEDMRLENDGDLHVEGDVIAFSTTISDATLKYDINPIEHALDKVAQLTGVTYKYLKDGMESAGLLAQDVEKVMPCAVNERKLPLHKDDGKMYKTLNYDNLHALLIESIKELTAKVERLEKK